MDANWGWAAGAGFVLLAWVAYWVLLPKKKKKISLVFGKKKTVYLKKRDYFMTRLWEGKDGRASFSKFQFSLWTFVVVFALLSIAIARAIASEGILEPVDEIPDNLLGVLGISVFTATGAKGVTTLFAARRLTKKRVKKEQDTTTPLQELVADDDGVPELGKIQMLLFTLVAVIIFLATTVEAINSGEESKMVLPDIDRALLVLMGISSAGYLGKKAITLDRPTITAVMPSEVRADKETPIMLTGRSLGTWEDGVLSIGDQLFKDDRKDIEEWSDSIISLKFTGKLLKGEDRRPYRVELVVGDTESTHQTLWVVKGEEDEAPSTESGEAKESGKAEGDSD